MHTSVRCAEYTAFQSLLLIDSESQRGTIAVKSECPDDQSPSRGYILGKILNSFVCSHNLPEALDGRSENKERNKRKSYDVKNGESEDLEMKDLLLELRSIEKKEESWAKWSLEYTELSKYDNL